MVVRVCVCAFPFEFVFVCFCGLIFVLLLWCNDFRLCVLSSCVLVCLC